MSIYEPPEREESRDFDGQTAGYFAGFLVICFILANMMGALQALQIVNSHGYGWNTRLGFVVVLQFSTHIIRCLIAALYFLKVRWFYWMLVTSMVVVYCIPSPPYPTNVVNTKGLIGLVVLIGIPLLIGQRQYILPWRNSGTRKGPA